MTFKRTLKRFAHLTGYTFVCYSENGDNFCTSGANDGDVRIWKEIGDDDPSSQCVGESAICLAQYDSSDDGSKLLVSTENNMIQVYTFPDCNRIGIELRFTALVTTIKVNETYIAAGSDDGNIKVQLKDKSEEYFELQGHEGPILHVDLSSKNLLASSSGDGTIKIWNLETKTVVKTFDGFTKINTFIEAQKFITPSFEPTGRYLAYPKDNQIHVLETTNWETRFTFENDKIPEDYSVCSFSKCGSFIAAGSVKGQISVWSLSDNLLLPGEYKGEEEYAITSLAWNPKMNGEIVFCDSDGQLCTIINCSSNGNDDDVDESSTVVSNTHSQEDPDDLYGGIDFHEDKKLEEKNSDAESSDDEDVKSKVSYLSGSNKSSKIERAPVKMFQVQPPFQSGSTPVHLEHRFMLWNHVGQVLSHAGDENSIIVEFHDVTDHPSLHIANVLNHEMASLSNTCLALGTKETPCRIVCIALSASGSKEWTTTMPGVEEIQCIATSSSFVAVATDAGFIRFFTIMGTQREVILVPGKIVTMAGNDNKLAVVYNNSSTSNKFSLMIINMVGLTMTSRTVDVPLTINSKISWLGFSDMGSIIAYDSYGKMICYNIKRSLWYPICDMTEHVVGASDTFFIISVSEREQKIQAALCRGTSYPILVNPRPIARELDFALPLCNMESEKSKLEDSLIRSANFAMDSANTTLVEKGLKLFSTAMNSELESRAYEIIELIRDKRLIELAARYATQKGRLHIASKISKMLTEFEEKENKKQQLLLELEQENELFAEDCSTPTNTANNMCQEINTVVIAPKAMISQKKCNPFKRGGSGANSPSVQLLAHLKYKSGESQSMDCNSPANVLKASNSLVSSDTPRPGNFGAWFVANKEELESNNPEMSSVELMKTAKVVYKNLTQKVKDSENPPSLPNSKRKLDMKEDANVSKLAKFGFVEN